jgi:hypothetical protein
VPFSWQISKLLVALNQYRSFPHFEESDMEHIFLALDDSGDNLVSEEEFLDMCVAVRLKFVPLDEPTFLEMHFPGGSYSGVVLVVFLPSSWLSILGSSWFARDSLNSSFPCLH